MFLVLAIILAAAWLFGFLIFHAAGFAIHLLLIVAIISVIVHFVKGGSAPECLGNHPASWRLELTGV